MAFNTYPFNPYPASTEQINKGDNEELQEQIGDLSDLETTAKTNIVSAVNEVNTGLTGLTAHVDTDTDYGYAESITIENAVPSPAKNLKVKIVPTQSGTGTPSPDNVRPITGDTEASVSTTDGTNTNTATITLGQTVYGGEVNFDTGVVTVDYANIASYDGETITEPWLSSMDEYVSGSTPTTGAQVVYKLATPTTLDLTPAELTLLRGQNTITTENNKVSLTASSVVGAIGELAEEVAANKPVNYSTTEQNTGRTWVDGKPIYQKTINFGNLPNNTIKKVNSGLTNVEIHNIYGVAKGPNGFTVPLPHAELSGSGNIVMAYQADNYVRLETDYDFSTYTAYITLQYTKTT